MDPYVANDPAAETTASEEEGVFAGGTRFIRGVGILRSFEAKASVVDF